MKDIIKEMLDKEIASERDDFDDVEKRTEEVESESFLEKLALICLENVPDITPCDRDNLNDQLLDNDMELKAASIVKSYLGENIDLYVEDINVQNQILKKLETSQCNIEYGYLVVKMPDAKEANDHERYIIDFEEFPYDARYLNDYHGRKWISQKMFVGHHILTINDTHNLCYEIKDGYTTIITLGMPIRTDYLKWERKRIQDKNSRKGLIYQMVDNSALVTIMLKEKDSDYHYKSINSDIYVSIDNSREVNCSDSLAFFNVYEGVHNLTLKIVDLDYFENNGEPKCIIKDISFETREGDIDLKLIFDTETEELVEFKQEVEGEVVYSKLYESREEIAKKVDEYLEASEYFRNQGKTALEREFYEKIIEIDRKNITALVRWGRSFSQSGEYEKARKMYTKALKINPEDPVTNCNMGAVCYREGKYLDALPYYEKGISMLAKEDVDYAPCMAGYGLTLGKCGDLVMAEKMLEKAEEAGYENTEEARKELNLKKKKGFFSFFK